LKSFRIAAAALLAAASLFALPAAHAQQGPGWFVPNQPQVQSRPPAAAARPPATRPAPRPEPAEPVGPVAAGPDQPDQPPDQPPPQIPAPPIPQLPALPKTAGPPAVVIGVLGVPEVMRASTAAQEVEKVIGARRDKLAQDAQKEQGAWRDIQQSVASQRAKLSQDQLRQKERELQERITKAQRDFRDRNRIIQAAAQYSLGQIESTLIAVIRQVAESRGMNLVLHRSQVALNINEFDITDQVAGQLNKILPSVQIPAENVDPATLVKQAASTQGAATLQQTPGNGPSAVLPANPAGGTPAAAPANPPAPASR
jgi:Skp family chaperone for outer membrane proteins